MSYPQDGGVYTFQDWVIDCGRRELRFANASIAIGSRAFDVLELLANSAGRLVTKDDLIDRVWSRIAIEENTLQVHISAIRRALGEDRALLKTISGRGYTLRGAWRFQNVDPPTDQPSPNSPERKPYCINNIPSARSPLVGREGALSELAHVLSAYPAVTLTGPGGIGKTQLAIELARRVSTSYDKCIALVELATLQDASLVIPTTARLLKLSLSAKEISAEAIANVIGRQRLLLVLDNCEHVIDQAAELADAILKGCPNVTILATSREALRIDGEYVAAVSPLAVPDVSITDPDLLLQGSAVQLFFTRTHALRPGFSPSPIDVLNVGAICRRLDGIPLAVELAAARAATLGLQAVLLRLDSRFDLLTVGNRTHLPKHQTLRATLDWSYDLLPNSEQTLLCYLAMFPSGFTLDAAVAMVDETASRSAVIEAVHNLVAKSLVSLDASSGDRWRLLETTRAYGLEKLREVGLTEHASRRHAGYFRQLIAPRPIVSHSTEDLTRFAQEIGNVHAALDWAFSSNDDITLGIELTAAFTPVWMQLLAFLECTSRIELAIARLSEAPNVHSSIKAHLYVALGFSLLNTTGSASRMQSALTIGLELAEGLGDLELQLKAVWTLWSYNLNSGQYGAASAVAQRYLDIARQTGIVANEAVGHRLLGAAKHFFGAQDEARKELSSSLATSVHHGSTGSNPMWFLLNQSILAKAMLARVLLLQGQILQSRAMADDCLEEAQAEQDKLSIAYALRNAVCPIALMTHDLTAARRATGRLRELVTREGISFWASWTSCLNGQLLILECQQLEGIERLRAGLAARANNGWLMRNPEFLGSLAEGLFASNQTPQALTAIDAALDISEQGHQLWCLSDLLRIKGEILFADAPDAISNYEACFSHGLSIARSQKCLFFELKVAASWAKAMIETNRPRDAVDLLAPICTLFDPSVSFPALDFSRSVITRLAFPLSSLNSA